MSRYELQHLTKSPNPVMVNGSHSNWHGFKADAYQNIFSQRQNEVQFKLIICSSVAAAFLSSDRGGVSLTSR